MRRVLTALMGSVALGLAAASPAAADVVDLPVSFRVRNVKRSQVVCPSDGREYTVRGHLVAPRGFLAEGRRRPRAVTLYLHGSLIGEAAWRSPVHGYDWPRRLARAGHASITIDQLGFGRSGLPDGMQVCVGSWADVAHQVVAELRDGRYALAGDRPARRFQRVGLASYCLGGLIAQVEAYSFKDVDAFVVLSSAFDQGFSRGAATDLFTNPRGPTLVCARGGERKEPAGPGSYAYVFPGTERAEWFSDADDAVVDAVVRTHEREPCGEGPSLAGALAADRRHLGEIAVPVLLVFGGRDAIFPPPAGERQRALFTGSRDVTLVELPDAGHALQLGRSAARARSVVASWLRRRGL